MTSVRVLVVDDEVDVREMVCEFVTNMGHQPVQAANGSEAVEILKKSQNQICAVVTDLNMPVMTGLEMIAKIRDMGLDLPIVVESGHLDQEMTIQALKFGAFDFLYKPYSMSQFKAVVSLAISLGLEMQKIDSEIEVAFRSQGEAKLNEMKKFKHSMIQLKYKRSA